MSSCARSSGRPIELGEPIARATSHALSECTGTLPLRLTPDFGMRAWSHFARMCAGLVLGGLADPVVARSAGSRAVGLALGYLYRSKVEMEPLSSTQIHSGSLDGGSGEPPLAGSDTYSETDLFILAGFFACLVGLIWNMAPKTSYTTGRGPDKVPRTRRTKEQIKDAEFKQKQSRERFFQSRARASGAPAPSKVARATVIDAYANGGRSAEIADWLGTQAGCDVTRCYSDSQIGHSCGYVAAYTVATYQGLQDLGHDVHADYYSTARSLKVNILNEPFNFVDRRRPPLGFMKS